MDIKNEKNSISIMPVTLTILQSVGNKFIQKVYLVRYNIKPLTKQAIFILQC